MATATNLATIQTVASTGWIKVPFQEVFKQWAHQDTFGIEHGEPIKESFIKFDTYSYEKFMPIGLRVTEATTKVLYKNGSTWTYPPTQSHEFTIKNPPEGNTGFENLFARIHEAVITFELRPRGENQSPKITIDFNPQEKV